MILMRFTDKFGGASDYLLRMADPVMVEDEVNVEKVFKEVLDVLSKDRLSKGATEQIKDAAAGSIKRQTSSEGLGRAISRGGSST